MSSLSHRVAGILIGLSIVLVSAAQLVFRYVMQHMALEGVDSIGGMVDSFSLRDLLLLSVGVGLYAASMLSWIFALSRFEVSFAYPMLSISYVAVYCGAIWLPALGESASLGKLTGIILIMLGVTLLFAGGRSTDPAQPQV